MERMEDENENKRKKKKKMFNLWIQPEPLNTYHSLGTQSMERWKQKQTKKLCSIYGANLNCQTKVKTHKQF